MRTCLTGLLTAALVVLATVPSHAIVARATTTLTIDNTAGGIGLPTSLIGGGTTGVPQMTHCLGRLETAEIRYWDDTTAPTSTTGFVVEPLEMLEFTEYDSMRNFRGIRTGATSGSLVIECTR